MAREGDVAGLVALEHAWARWLSAGATARRGAWGTGARPGWILLDLAATVFIRGHMSVQGKIEVKARTFPGCPFGQSMLPQKTLAGTSP